MENKFTIGTISTALKEMWPSRKFMVPCLVGQPGIGKTQSVYALRDWVRETTEFKECKVVEMITSTILPSEVSGITMPDVEHRSLDIFDHVKLSSLKDGDILFFDELLQGSEQVLKACLTLIMERRMLSGKMLPDVMIVAACNNKEIRMVEPSIRQRFIWLDVTYNEVEFSDFLKENGVQHPQYLCNLIEFNTNCWNIQTPRSIYNLYRWYVNANDKSVAHNAINVTFGTLVADNIERAADLKTVNQLDEINKAFQSNAIIDLLRPSEKVVIDGILADESSSAYEIIKNIGEFIMDCENSEKIAEVLKNTVYEECL